MKACGKLIGVVRERSRWPGGWIPADRRERHDYQLEIPDTHTAAHGDLLICEKLPGPAHGGPKMRARHERKYRRG